MWDGRPNEWGWWPGAVQFFGYFIDRSICVCHGVGGVFLHEGCG